MRKLTLITGVLLVVALALAGGLSAPRPAWAVCGCETYDDFSTGLNWGKGSDCTAAHNDLLARVNAEARGVCGGTKSTCLGTLHITTACHWNGSQYQEDGYRDYSCVVCGPIW